MKSRFSDASVSAALERSIRNASFLKAKDAAAVAAARALARKIDAWDVIAEWALEDVHDEGKRPAVPQNDNVSLASFLKYLDMLGLVPTTHQSKSAGRQTAAEPEPRRRNDFDTFLSEHKVG